MRGLRNPPVPMPENRPHTAAGLHQHRRRAHLPSPIGTRKDSFQKRL